MSLLTFSLLYCLNTNGFHVAVGLFSNRPYKMSTCGKNVGNWVIVKKSYPKNLLAYCRSTVNRQSADRFFGELFFTITRTWMTHSLNGSLCNIFVCYTFWHDLLSITEQTCHRGIYLLMSIVLCDLQMKIWRMAKHVYWIQLSTQHACFHECKIAIQDIFFA